MYLKGVIGGDSSFLSLQIDFPEDLCRKDLYQLHCVTDTWVEQELENLEILVLTNEPTVDTKKFGGSAVLNFSRINVYEFPPYPQTLLMNVKKSTVKTQDNILFNKGSWTERSEDFYSTYLSRKKTRTAYFGTRFEM